MGTIATMGAGTTMATMTQGLPMVTAVMGPVRSAATGTTVRLDETAEEAVAVAVAVAGQARRPPRRYGCFAGTGYP
jgi:hypothetical protein